MSASDEWISLREFARRRSVALAAVQKAIESGRVTAVRRNAAGRLVGIAAQLATDEWNRNTDPVEAAKSGKSLDTPAKGAGSLNLEPPAPSSPAAPAGSGDKGDYYEHRAMREKYAALREEREHLEALGMLVSAEQVAKVAGQRYRAIRDKLLNIADRQAAILAAETEPVQVHAILTAEIKRVLHELSDDAQAEAARGAEERVAA